MDALLSIRRSSVFSSKRYALLLAIVIVESRKRRGRRGGGRYMLSSKRHVYLIHLILLACLPLLSLDSGAICSAESRADDRIQPHFDSLLGASCERCLYSDGLHSSKI